MIRVDVSTDPPEAYDDTAPLHVSTDPPEAYDDTAPPQEIASASTPSRYARSELSDQVTEPIGSDTAVSETDVTPSGSPSRKVMLIKCHRC